MDNFVTLFSIWVSLTSPLLLRRDRQTTTSHGQLGWFSLNRIFMCGLFVCVYVCVGGARAFVFIRFVNFFRSGFYKLL